jgi:hypothetical protein
MKLTKTYLRKIIKEETVRVLNEDDNYDEPEDEHVYPSGLREMDRETLDLYDQAIRLGHERLVGLIEWLKDYRDNPDSVRTK